MSASASATETVESYGEFDSRIPRIVVDDVKLSLRSCIRKASFQSVEQVLVEELKLNRDGDSFAHSPT